MNTLHLFSELMFLSVIRMIQEFLGVWARSPSAYEQLRRSELLVLPSPKLLIRYKNSIKQTVGFNKDHFEWMKREAVRVHVPSHGLWGGLMFDEMALQVCTLRFVKYIINYYQLLRRQC